MRKRVRFDELEVPIPRGYERITDRDETRDYLYLNAPRDIYTLYFDSGMPLYDQSVLNGCKEGGTVMLKLQDRRISLYCPSGFGDPRAGLLYFNVEFETENGEVLSLPGQLLVNSSKVYRQTENGTLPFIHILKTIRLKSRAGKPAAAIPV